MISSKNNEKRNYDVKVTRAKEIQTGCIAFDMVVNGITIYSMIYRAGVSKKTNEEYELISFPQKKGANEKYYNHVWFKIDDEVKKEIIDQLGELI